jgi:hypothetical protein
MRHVVVPVAVLLWFAIPGRAEDPAALEFFEKKIRPVLAEHCLSCHSAAAAQAKKLKAGLYLDTRDGLLKGGDSGPAVVVGKPGDSLLIQAVHFTGDTKMPPKGKLPAAVIADFEKWVAMGLPDPRTAAVARKQVGMSVEDGRTFWAFKPVAAPTPPAVKGDWAKADIDRFILAGLQAKKLSPAAPASPEVLARRLYYDLTGLPPTPEQVDAFVAAAKRNPGAAIEELVDRLLASPEFGERWGRHWLDVARFGESLTLRGFVFKEAWRYRDYVIDSFNKDVPFDRFVREQVAGDLLPAATPEDRHRQLVATTFLALGNTNLEEQDKKQLRMDVVDEQLDVITKGFLAQTVTCARCHDHKFDPIPTKDYYALAGILRNAKAMEHANVSKWIEVPLPAPPEEEAKFKAHEKLVADLQAKIKTAKAKASPKTVARAIPVTDIPGVVVDDAQAKKVGEWQHSVHSGHFIGDGYLHDQDKAKGEKTLTFQPDLPAAGRYEVRLAYSPGTSRSEAVPVTVFSADGEKTVNVDMRKPPPIDDRFVSLGEYRVEKNGQGYVIVSTEGTKGHVTVDAITFIPLDKPLPKGTPRAKGEPNTVKALEAELKHLQETGPKRAMVMTVVEEAKIEDTKVHVRGSVHNLGEAAPRGFLQVATTGPAANLPADKSGRKELADWIASQDNPLTARVYVNRAWHWLFGSGLVRTTDNFGVTGETPSHPELLDHLATKFVADGWSVKKLVREIVLSQAYQQAAVNEAATTADPENRLFGRANRRRLEAECIRDTMLAVSGQLSPERGGPTFPATLAADYGYKDKTAATRRSVYLPAFRNAFPEALEAFDAADPSTVTGRRNTSTVAPQALFLLNHPFPAEQATHAATRLLAEDLKDDAARLARAYRRALGREPTAGEREVAGRFLGKNEDRNAAWAAVFHALFASADFRYVD